MNFLKSHSIEDDFEDETVIPYKKKPPSRKLSKISTKNKSNSDAKKISTDKIRSINSLKHNNSMSSLLMQHSAKSTSESILNKNVIITKKQLKDKNTDSKNKNETDKSKKNSKTDKNLVENTTVNNNYEEKIKDIAEDIKQTIKKSTVRYSEKDMEYNSKSLYDRDNDYLQIDTDDNSATMSGYPSRAGSSIKRFRKHNK